MFHLYEFRHSSAKGFAMSTIRPASLSRRAGLLRTGALPLLLLAASSAHAQEGVPEIPAIPAIIVPDFIGVEASQQEFEVALGDRLAEIDGIRITPARCDADAVLVPGLGTFLQDGTGTVADLGESGTYIVDGAGAGVVDADGTRLIVEADGSGVIDREGFDGGEGVQVTVEADGSGTYSTPFEQITLDGRGGGTWTSERTGQVSIETDGSGVWNGPLGEITNDGDGSGTWNGAHQIINEGNGQGLVDGKPVAMAPLPPVPPAGKFPLLNKLRAPAPSCGYLVTLEDRILFDFDKSDLRPDAAATVDALAEAFVEVGPARLEVRGHTDSKGSDDYNQALSERRARTVAGALQEREVASAIEAAGFGESQPVAANEIGGDDNPVGRQLNRRVEIYVPSH